MIKTFNQFINEDMDGPPGHDELPGAPGHDELPGAPMIPGDYKSGINNIDSKQTGADADSEYDFIAENPEYNWLVLNENGKPKSGWEYLKDAIIDGYLGDLINPDYHMDLDEAVENELGTYGYGEPDDNMDDYDQSELDDIIERIKSVIGLRDIVGTDSPELFYRIVKKDEL